MSVGKRIDLIVCRGYKPFVYHSTVSQPSETTRFGGVPSIPLHVRYYGDVYSSFEFIIEVEAIDESPSIQEDRGEHYRLGRTDDS